MSFEFSHLTNVQGLQYGFSSKNDGSMNRNIERENRATYFNRIGIGYDNIVTADLVHGANIKKVGSNEKGTYIPDCDGLITNNEGVFLSATGADCFIIYFFDPQHQAVGIGHAGWRGILGGIVANTVSSFIEHMGTSPEALLVGISPGIQACHFEISPDDSKKYDKYPGCIVERDVKTFIDLTSILKQQLQNEGVLENNVEDSGICTYCDKQEYFSFRRDKPEKVQVMTGYIGLT